MSGLEFRDSGYKKTITRSTDESENKTELKLPSGYTLFVDAFGKLKVQGKTSVSHGPIEQPVIPFFNSICSEDIIKKEFIALLASLKKPDPFFSHDRSQASINPSKHCEAIRANPYSRMLKDLGMSSPNAIPNFKDTIYELQ